MNKTQQSELIRDWLKNQLKELEIFSNDRIRELAQIKVTEEAMFRLAQIWIGDLELK
jgi:hypothetical protein